MRSLQRRTFIQLVLAAIPASVFARPGDLATAPSAVRVAAGRDREGKKHAIGVSSTTYKVLTRETAGAMFVLEQSNHVKGGPPRHLHHDVDELFYVLEGEYIVEIGSERTRLRSGDCVLGPREVPHGWAFAGGAPGRMLISFAPAGRMEAYFAEREARGSKPGSYGNDAAFLREYGMELEGPSLVVD